MKQAILLLFLMLLLAAAYSWCLCASYPYRPAPPTYRTSLATEPKHLQGGFSPRTSKQTPSIGEQ